MFHVWIAMPLALLAPVCIAQMPSGQTAGGYQWVDLARCSRPAKAPAGLPADSGRRFNAQRRWLDLDGDGVCELMEVWVERLEGSDSPGMRTLDHRFLAFRKGAWQPFVTELKYFPYALDSTNGRRVYVEAARASDVGDDMAVGTENIRVLQAPTWQQTVPGTLPELTWTEMAAPKRGGCYRRLQWPLHEG